MAGLRGGAGRRAVLGRMAAVGHAAGALRVVDAVIFMG